MLTNLPFSAGVFPTRRSRRATAEEGWTELDWTELIYIYTLCLKKTTLLWLAITSTCINRF